MDSNTPLVSVIVVNFNGKHHLRECFDSIGSQTWGAIETICVDNASSDGSCEFIRRQYPDVRLIENSSNKGFCGGNNDGIRIANGEYIFLLNNDTVLERDCIETLVRFMMDAPSECIGAFPMVYFYYAPMFINSAGVMWNYQSLWRDFRIGLVRTGYFKGPQKVFGAMFIAVMLRRQTFQEIGLFDQAMFTYGEDFDVCYRANAMGYCFYLVPDARLSHKFRASSNEKADPLWSYYLYLRNYLYMLLKNLSLKELWSVRGYIHELYFSNIRWAYQNREWKRLWVAVKVVIGLIRRIKDIIKWRAVMAQRRKAQDFAFWDFERREPHNIFYYCNHPVLSELSLKTSLYGSQEYVIDNQIVKT